MRFTNGVFKMLSLCLLAGVLVAGIMFPVVGALGVASNRASDTIDSAQAEMVEVPPALITSMVASNGQRIATLYDQYRIPVAAEQISPIMKEALISIEDRRFYEHHGVDWKGTTRAALSTSGGNQQGGSTLTQQYVKNYLINVVYRNNKSEQQKAQEPTIARKLREARIALQLEQKMSKEAIITGYLNVVEFSNSIYGIGAAAQTYFNTTPDKLTVPQAAMLAGMVQNPSLFNPWRFAPKALERRNVVIDTMIETGRLTRADGDAAKASPLGVAEEPVKPAKNCTGAGPEAGFFCQYVVEYLEKLGFTQDQLAIGGYTIKTSLDLNATSLAKKATMDEVPKTTEGIANVMAIVKPGKEKHQVLALVSNRDYGTDAAKGQTTYPQPYGIENKFGTGSIYKIFTAAAALEKGLGINSVIDTPNSYTSRLFIGGNPKNCPRTENPRDGRDTSWYCLSNSGDHYPDRMTLQQALAMSPNTGFVKLEEMLGSTDPVVDMLTRLGMRDTMASNMNGKPAKPGEETQAQHFKSKPGYPGNAALTLGPSPLSPLELANVAATLMSGGVWCPPSPIVEIIDRNGNPVDMKGKEAPCEQAVAEPLANTLVTGLSKDREPGGTAYNAGRRAGWTRPMMGKTGTTQEFKSAGFVGATPQYAGAVQTFNDGPRPRPIRDTDPPSFSNTGNIYGGKVPAQTWFAAMKPLHGNEPELPLPPVDQRYVDGGPEIRVPDVVGKTEQEATNILQGAGYQVSVVQRDDSRKRGTVVGQTPRGTKLPGGTITIYVSTGVAPVQHDTTTNPPPSSGGAPPSGGEGGGGGGDPGGGDPGGGGGGGGGDPGGG
ncbi:transglycosylase domain-containing protein [Kibdelosporangium aridum]|uniref:Membrane carboxypeptidase (Penicillin-binding protein) n=1 Tax=Kibdelosporangium aridum TaxID=2030 RepID=A0A1Y5XLM0_KIBAR|nr:transglycosylase domain-containing protein [Kibdelosporangium aridum]SMC99267.1 Membrane carboxypeptidase (penicillin-binding protein) [Kibdelosporangium aridum]